MSESNADFDNNSVTEVGKRYVEKTLAYYKLKLLKALTENISGIIKIILLSIFILITLLFLSVALAIYLGAILKSNAFGYVLVASIYTIVALVIYLLRKMIDNKVLNKINKLLN
jgi:hypothetical protein